MSIVDPVQKKKKKEKMFKYMSPAAPRQDNIEDDMLTQCNIVKIVLTFKIHKQK